MCVFLLCVWYLPFFVVRYEYKKCKSLKEKQAKLFGKYNLSETQLGTLAVWQTYGNQDNCRLHQYWKLKKNQTKNQYWKLRKLKTKNKTKTNKNNFGRRMEIRITAACTNTEN